MSASREDKRKAIDSYSVWVEELMKMVAEAEKRGIPKEWSENFIIAMLPPVFRKEAPDVRLP